MANAETSVPAVAIVILRAEEISARIPTMTNSLVPRTNVRRDNVAINSQSRRLKRVVGDMDDSSILALARETMSNRIA